MDRIARSSPSDLTSVRHRSDEDGGGQTDLLHLAISNAQVGQAFETILLGRHDHSCCGKRAGGVVGLAGGDALRSQRLEGLR